MKIDPIGFTVFIIFFGAATLDAITTRSWLRSIFWLAMGVVFFIAGNWRKSVQTK
ncbi:MAG TPA: hypothetical protein VFZ40_06260 [Pyrinomonadaceae bacterium]